MSKRKDRGRADRLLESVAGIAAAPRGPRPGEDREDDEADGTDETDGGHGGHGGGAPVPDALLASSRLLAGALTAGHAARRELPRMKKFRFQLLHQWMTAHIAPCRAADVGGGKGMLAYLLRRSGWDAAVIDPVRQPLPAKYRDLATGRLCRIGPDESVPRQDRGFAPEIAADFDLLVALHAHGCNIQMIDAAAAYGRDLVLLPCCIIGEPLVPPPGVHWLECVAEYAAGKGFAVEPFLLNFKGQNVGLYVRHAPGGRPGSPAGPPRP